MKHLRKNGRGVEEKASDMTIKDIAKESGYGIGTVSRVLNNNPNVSKKAYEKIMEVVNAHNYQPNPNARHLKMQAQKGVAPVMDLGGGLPALLPAEHAVLFPLSGHCSPPPSARSSFSSCCRS